MKNVVNKRNRRTTIPLRGGSLILNKRGDSGILTDEQALEEAVVGFVNSRAIVVEAAPAGAQPTVVANPTELKRIQAMEATRAKLKNRAGNRLQRGKK